MGLPESLLSVPRGIFCSLLHNHMGTTSGEERIGIRLNRSKGLDPIADEYLASLRKGHKTILVKNITSEYACRHCNIL